MIFCNILDIGHMAVIEKDGFDLCRMICVPGYIIMKKIKFNKCFIGK